MNEGNITVVDVIATDDGYQLSRPAQDLYIAYEVVRRHIDSDGVRHYAQMSSAKITDDGYEFKFENGDVFTCASHEDRPASATVSDLQTAKPMTFYSTTTNNAQLKKGSSSGSNTGKDEWDAIVEAMDNGLPVMVKIGDFSYPVIALYSAVSIETAYDRENKVVLTGFGNSGTTQQTRMVWKKPKNNTEDA